MPSLSKTVALNGWMTLSPWVIYLGLVTICSPATAQLASTEAAQPASAHPVLEAGSEAQKPGLFNVPEVDVASVNPDAVQPQSSATGGPRAATQTDLAQAESQTESASAAFVSNVSNVSNVTVDPALTAQAGASQGPAGQVTLSTDECLVACNPSERFLFNPPTDIAIPPRSAYPRPQVAQSPARSPGSASAPSAASAAANPFPTQPSSSQPLVNQPLPGQSLPSQSLPSQSLPSQTAQAAELQPAPAEVTDPTAGSRRALTPPTLQLQGVYLYQGGEGSARIRVTGVYPILPELQVGGSIDFTDGPIFSESNDDGLSVNELYAAASLPGYPNLRLIVGQIDFTSYFDRNSFAKDGATQFFNPVFATNPALSAAGLGSRQGAVVNWTITDNLEAKAGVFSSDRSIGDFGLNGFAGELGGRLGNLIVRGTYVTGTDSGADTGFEEIFGLRRSNGDFGLRSGDREDGYGINAEYFIPEIRLGLFARYGWYENRGIDQGGTTYSVGANLLDLFMQGDRLGLGYGRLLSSNRLRNGNNPDVFEIFYDFQVLDFLRLGVTFQALDEFSETIAGFRIRTDFDLIPRRGQ